MFRAFSGPERKDFLPLLFLFVGFKRGENYLRVLCIRPMHRLAVVAKCLLSESLRIPGNSGSLRPGVTIGMEGDSVDPGFPAYSLEMGRAMPFFQLGESGKQ